MSGSHPRMGEWVQNAFARLQADQFGTDLPEFCCFVLIVRLLGGGSLVHLFKVFSGSLFGGRGRTPGEPTPLQRLLDWIDPDNGAA